LIGVPSKRASIHFVPAKYTAATDYLRRDPRRRPSLAASRLAHREQNYWIFDLGRIESLVLTLKDAADCQKTFAPVGACHPKGVALETSRRPVVLAVEDEPLILMLAVDMIRDAGFEPLWASNADEAISILESRDDIKIVFTDISMPGSMDGIKLARAVRGRWPPIKIIVTSGFSGSERKLLPEGSQFIPKPYNPSQISDALHRLAA
jgi:CheY-like chemotaxis protein